MSVPRTDGSPAVSYTVSLTEPQTHCISVRMHARGVGRALKEGKLALEMPVWTPGSYLVREFSRNVLSIQAMDGAGRRLHLVKETKNRWVVHAGEDDELVVDYVVYAFSFGTNSSYVDSDHAVLNGASVFLYIRGMEREAVRVQILPHAPWSQVTTGLERAAQWSFTAPDYDVLVDSPMEVGNQHVHRFEVGGVQHEVSLFTGMRIDEGRLVGDIEKIVRETIPIFGEIPYSRYAFLIDFTADGYAGLEHLNSTLCIAAYLAMAPPQEYREQLALFSHEFFHTWNVKRMRPVALGPFDYSGENYTKSLWIAEGLTSYYEDVILRRAGILPVSEYLDHLSIPISHVKGLPSSRWQTPEEASFDSWIKYYRQDENTPNVAPSYYRQGAVLGLLLDLQLRHSSEGKATLDHVMRKVYSETYRNGRGYTDDEFERASDEFSAGGTSEIFGRHVHGKEEIDFDGYLGMAGLRLLPRSQPSADEGFLGIRVRGAPNLSVVTRLIGSPAEKCDLSAGDEIIATDGLRTDVQRLGFYIANKKPGDAVELTVTRGGVLRSVRATLGRKPVLEYRIQKKAEASEKEKALFRGWGQADWDEPLVFSEHRASPMRSRPFDYL